MKIFISSTDPTMHSVKRIIEELQNQNIQYQLINPYKKVEIEQLDSSSILINRVSGINYDDADLQYYEKLNIKVYNEPNSSRVFRDKSKQYNFFKLNSIPTIETLALDCTAPKELESFCNSFEEQRFLLKPYRSNRAQGIIETSLPLENYQYLKSKNDLRYILQPFLPKKCEWRILIIDKDIIGIMRKNSESLYSILNCESAQLTLIERPSLQLDDFLQNCIQKIPLFMYALDVLELPDGTLKLIEVNSMPGLKHVENICNKNIAEIFITKLRAHHQSRN